MIDKIINTTRIRWPAQLKRRSFMAVTGTILIGAGVGGLQKVNLGVDPCTSLVTGLAHMLHSDYGTCFPIITGILLMLFFFCNRRLIGISTVLNMLIVSRAAAGTRMLLDKCIHNDDIYTRLFLLFITLFIICFASSLFYTADLGVPSYDAIALTLSGKYHIASFRVCRVVCDLIGCLIGLIFGASIGIGTIITAFFMGPVIQWFNTHFTEKYLYQKQKNQEDI